MKKISFAKAVASGNDFVVIERSLQSVLSSRPQSLARKMCDRKFGIGADGLLLLEKSKVADVKMRIFNADGSEAQMCGNGARCVALYISHHVTRGSPRHQRSITIETKAGIIEAKVSDSNVRIKLTAPKDYTPAVSIKINGRELKINSINTGVPHAVIFVEGIEHIDVSNLGRQIRYCECFAPSGTNVDFVEVVDKDTIKVRTYERGVEDETLACGTGAAAAAIAYSLQSTVNSPHCQAARSKKNRLKVITQGKETLKVYFDRKDDTITNVWLEGKVKIAHMGVSYV